MEDGKGLVCSFPQCRNTGIKFRYCKFCDDAIARRNFKRHQHSDKDTQENKTGRPRKSNPQPGDEENSKEVEHEVEKNVSSSSSESSGSQADVSDELDAEDSGRRLISSADASVPKSDEDPDASLDSENSQSGEEAVRAPLLPEQHSDRVVVESRRSSRAAHEIQGEHRQPSTKRRDLWAALLMQRPTDDGRAMHRWLDKIQSVSNLNIPDEALGLSEASSSD